MSLSSSETFSACSSPRISESTWQVGTTLVRFSNESLYPECGFNNQGWYSGYLVIARCSMSKYTKLVYCP